GLPHLSKRIRRLGLQFGLWVEPEMVNADSDLYRQHPEWAIRHPVSKPALGRRQLMLDLSNPAVIDHLDETLSSLFERAGVDYVKWDMNRNVSDLYSQYLSAADQGKLAHLYVLGLYRLLGRLKARFPSILFESCASGGNRFDLGMHYYMPQAWTSDNTDAYERLHIQRGTALAYPLSTISNHINDDVAHQTLRQVPLETRYNVAAFGVLGLELDTTGLSPFQKRLIRDQLNHYKTYRHLFQQGRLYDLSEADADQRLLVVNETKALAALGLFQGLNKPNPPYQCVRLVGLDPDKIYRVTARKQAANLRTFGNLIRHALPIRLKAHGTLFNALSARYRFYEPEYSVVETGRHLMGKGLTLPYRFTGSGYHEALRIMPDFGSKIYMIEEVKHG
ncbi:MAG: alpha-galactosidase, partial [Acholeplasmatales bacterium]